VETGSPFGNAIKQIDRAFQRFHETLKRSNRPKGAESVGAKKSPGKEALPPTGTAKSQDGYIYGYDLEEVFGAPGVGIPVLIWVPEA
jgi:hypothetical protein